MAQPGDILAPKLLADGTFEEVVVTPSVIAGLQDALDGKAAAGEFAGGFVEKARILWDGASGHTGLEVSDNMVVLGGTLWDLGQPSPGQTRNEDLALNFRAAIDAASTAALDLKADLIDGTVPASQLPSIPASQLLTAAVITRGIYEGETHIFYRVPDIGFGARSVYQNGGDLTLWYDLPAATWRISFGQPFSLPENIVASSDPDSADYPWLAAWVGDCELATLEETTDASLGIWATKSEVTRQRAELSSDLATLESSLGTLSQQNAEAASITGGTAYFDTLDAATAHAAAEGTLTISATGDILGSGTNRLLGFVAGGATY